MCGMRSIGTEKFFLERKIRLFPCECKPLGILLSLDWRWDGNRHAWRPFSLFVEKMGRNEKTHSFWYKRVRGAVEYALIVIMYPHPGDLHSRTSSVFQLPSFLSIKYQTTPLRRPYFEASHAQPTRTLKNKKWNVVFFSYLDQDGGQKEPRCIKSSLHIFEFFLLFFFGKESEMKRRKKKIIQMLGVIMTRMSVFWRKNQLDSRWRQ